MFNKSRLAFAVAILLLVPNVTYAHSKAAFHDAMRRLWSDRSKRRRSGRSPSIGRTS